MFSFTEDECIESQKWPVHAAIYSLEGIRTDYRVVLKWHAGAAYWRTSVMGDARLYPLATYNRLVCSQDDSWIYVSHTHFQNLLDRLKEYRESRNLFWQWLAANAGASATPVSPLQRFLADPLSERMLLREVREFLQISGNTKPEIPVNVSIQT
jgi:hypothetical protein